MTRNITEASAPGSAAAEEAAPLGDFGELVMEQPDDNSTQIDPGPTPALHESLPPGMATPLPCVTLCHQVCHTLAVKQCIDCESLFPFNLHMIQQ